MIAPSDIPTMWDRIADKIAAALMYGDGCYRLSDVRQALATGEWQLWTDGESIACTRIAEYPARRILFVMMAEGTIASVLAIWAKMREFGEICGCTGAKWMARPGWRRSGALPAGWKHTHDMMTLEF